MVKHKSLAEENPNLLKEWDYEKNNEIGIYPDKVTACSGRKVWWKCKRGHEWQRRIADRRRGDCCPYCSAGGKTSFPEQAVYYFLDMLFHDEIQNRCRLKDKKGDIEADIYLFKQKIVIEYDGVYWHGKKQEKDIDKEFRLKRIGVRFIRIAEHNRNEVIDNCILYDCYKSRDENLTWAIQELFAMLNVSSLFVNVSAFRDKILEFTRTNEVKNSLAEVNPELAKEWNHEKNGKFKPTMVTLHSGVKVWWKCKHGHSWQTTVKHRVEGNGCPYCSGKKVLSGFNDLATLQPDLLSEWDYEKNNKHRIYPDKVTCGSRKKAWWKCNKGHSWKTFIVERALRGTGCPICSNQKILSGYNDLATLNPELVEQWNFEKNGDLLPSMVACGSTKKVWWKCSKGHEWKTSIYVRAKKGLGCPYCSNQKVLKGYNDLATLKPELVKEWDYDKNNKLGIYPDEVTCGSGKKVWWKCNKGHEWQTVINKRSIRKYGCPYCSNQRVLSGYNDLATINPKLAQQWDYEKNRNLLPTMVAHHSNVRVWWKCSKGHEWQASISSRAVGDSGCPICVNQKVLSGYNDLATLNPELANEWDYEKNRDLLPSQVTCGTDRKVWWKCKVCGHEWQAGIGNRNRLKQGCPECAKRNRWITRRNNRKKQERL